MAGGNYLYVTGGAKPKTQKAKRATVVVAKRRKTPRSMIAMRSPFPRTKSMVLTYADCYYGAVSGAGGYANLQIGLNNLHDPEQSLTNLNRISPTTGGHQPYYYDQIRAMYGHYVVTKCRVTCTVMHTGYTITMMRDNSDNAGVPTNFSLEYERPNCSTVVCSGNGDSKTMTKTWDIAKLAGITRKQLIANENYWGGAVTSAGPTTNIYANIQAIYLDYATSFTAQMSVRIDYWCTFFDPEEVVQS